MNFSRPSILFLSSHEEKFFCPLIRWLVFVSQHPDLRVMTPNFGPVPFSYFEPEKNTTEKKYIRVLFIPLCHFCRSPTTSWAKNRNISPLRPRPTPRLRTLPSNFPNATCTSARKWAWTRARSGQGCPRWAGRAGRPTRRRRATSRRTCNPASTDTSSTSTLRPSGTSLPRWGTCQGTCGFFVWWLLWNYVQSIFYDFMTNLRL